MKASHLPFVGRVARAYPWAWGLGFLCNSAVALAEQVEPPSPAASSAPQDTAPSPESSSRSPDHMNASNDGLGAQLFAWWQQKLGDKTPVALEVVPYGMIVTNAVLNNGAAAPTLDALIIAQRGSLLDAEIPGQGSLVLTARQSRAGLQVAYRWPQGLRADANLEMDLWGLHETEGPGTATQTSFRLRHAFFRLGDERLQLIIGQTWSVVTPRLPTSLGHMAVALHSMSGALWNRLPQLTVELDRPILGTWRGRFRLSITRPHSGDGEVGLTRFETPEPGLLSQLPWAQARYAFYTRGFEFGVAGHVGRERYEVVRGTETDPGYRFGELRYDSVDVATWLSSLDFRWESPGGWLNGQLWVGENINGLFGHHGVYIDKWDAADVYSNGAMTGLNQDVIALAATGAWLEAGLDFRSIGWKAVVSGAFETGPQNAVAYGALYRNMSLFGGLFYRVVEPLDASLEYLHTFSFYRPDLSSRDLPGYRPDQDLLFGGDPPSRETMGHHGSLSLNFRFRF